MLHVIDTTTRFLSAIFLDAHGATYGQSVEGIRLAFVGAWCTMYTGLLNRHRVEQGYAFTSDRWCKITSRAGIQLRISGVKAHSSLGTGERLHGPLRSIYRKVRADFPDAPSHSSQNCSQSNERQIRREQSCPFSISVQNSSALFDHRHGNTFAPRKNANNFNSADGNE